MSAECRVKRRELTRAENPGHGRFESQTAARDDQRMRFVNNWWPWTRCGPSAVLPGRRCSQAAARLTASGAVTSVPAQTLPTLRA
jgi:hypothetical protein